MLKLKTKTGITQTTVAGGVIKFGEDGFAKGFYDAAGNRVGKVPESLIQSLSENPAFSVLRVKDSGNVAAELPADNSDDESGDEVWEDKETANIASSKTVATKTKKGEKGSSSKRNIEV